MANKTVQDAILQGAIPQPVTLVDSTGVSGSSLQNKLLSYVTISSGGGVGSTSITFSSSPTGLKANQGILLSGGTQEVVYAASSYVAGTNPVPLQSAIINASHTAGSFDIFIATGPGTIGMTPFGVSSTTNVIYDTASGNYFLPVSAASDGIAPANVQEVAIGLYNSSGSVIDRLRDAGSLGNGVTIGLLGAAQFVFNGGSYDPLRSPTTFKTIAAVAITAGTPVGVWTPGAGKKFHLMGYAISLSVAGSVIFKDGGTEIFRTPLMAASVGQSNPANFANGYASTAANNLLNLDVTATGTVTGFVFGTEEF